MSYVLAAVIVAFVLGVVIGCGMAPIIDMLLDEDYYREDERRKHR